MVQEEYIRINHLSKTFGKGEKELHVLDDIDFNVRQGEFICIVGGSGCGKSTLLRAIAGIDSNHEGTVTIKDVVVTKPEKERGMVFQEHRLFPWLTVEQNVGFALNNLNRQEKKKLVEEHIELVELSGFKQAYPHQLSGGMAQRISIARALVNQPEVLLLDEPFGALDAFTKMQMQIELLYIKKKEGTTMILVTHDIEEAVFLADRIVVMSAKPGRIKSIVNDDLPRPRNRNSIEFMELRKRIYNELFEDPDYNVTVHWTDFESGPPMNESFAAGQQDIGVIGDVPAVSAIAAGQKNTLVAVAADGGPAYAILAAADSDIQTVADLKGKTIGTVVGSTAQNLTDKLLSNAGLDINSDVTLINITVGDAQSVLTSGQVYTVAIWEPNVTRLVADGTAKIIGDGSDVGFRGVNVIFARSEYVEKNADIVQVVLEQYYKGAQEFANNPEEVSNLIADNFSLDPELLVSAGAKYDYTVAFDDADIEALQDTVSFLTGIDAITNEITVKDYVNNEIASKAVAK